MGNRLGRIRTGSGDRGTTGLADGSRVAKDDPRVEAMGAVDELNSLLGVLVAELAAADPLRPMVLEIQNDLFDLGAELAVPGHEVIHSRRVERLEQSLRQLNEELPPLKEFILPGGGRAAVCCHQARCVCRRAERRMVSLGRSATLNPELIRYLNCLSDLLFVSARVLARRDGGSEQYWQPRQD